jgi:hypothetical protein
MESVDALPTLLVGKDAGFKRKAASIGRKRHALIPGMGCATGNSSNDGNPHARNYLTESASNAKRHCLDCGDRHKLFADASINNLKRALALTVRKLVKLIYGLLAKMQLYVSPPRESRLNLS